MGYATHSTGNEPNEKPSKIELDLSSRQEIEDQVRSTLFSQNKLIETSGHNRAMLCDVPLRHIYNTAYNALCISELFPTDDIATPYNEQEVSRAYFYSFYASYMLHAGRHPDSWREFVPFVLKAWNLGRKNTKNLLATFDIRKPAFHLSERVSEYEALNKVGDNMNLESLLSDGEKLLKHDRDYALKAIEFELEALYGPGNRYQGNLKKILEKSSNGVVYYYAYVLSLAQQEDIFSRYSRKNSRINHVVTNWVTDGNGGLY